MSRLQHLALVCFALIACSLMSGQAAKAEPVDLELVLAVDSSASVDFNEFNLQLKGLADAFRDPEIIEIIGDGAYGAIAVTLVEWASQNRQTVSIPWTMISDEASALAFATRIDNAPRRIESGATAIADALVFAASLFPDNGFEGTRRVIDISGDGYNNQGLPLFQGRGAVLTSGITINAIGIENELMGLTIYFEKALIGGPGAFAIQASDYDDYLTKIRRKLIRELQAPPVS